MQKSGRCAGKPYRKSQKAYAVDYNVSLPTVKRWWAKGLPCDDPDAMGEFVSNRGRKAAEGGDDFDSPSIVSPADDSDDFDPLAGARVPEVPSPVVLDESFYAGTGFQAEIEKLQHAARERRGAYFNAVSRNRLSTEIRNRLHEWMSVVESLRKVEKDLPGIRKANDQAVDRAELEVALGQMFQAFRAQVNVAFVRLIEKLGLGDDADAVEAAESATERLLSTLAMPSLVAAGDNPESTEAAGHV